MIFSLELCYLTVILRGRAGYELIYITNEAVGRVGYYQLISIMADMMGLREPIRKVENHYPELKIY